jgi:pilus assembly protein CpaC
MKYRRMSAYILFACILLALPADMCRAANNAKPVEKIMTVGESYILSGKEIRRVAVGDPQIADVVVLSSAELLVNAKSPGSTPLYVWESSGRVTYEIAVRNTQLDLIGLSMRIQQEIKDPRISVRIVGNTLLLEGSVSTEAEATRAETIARAMIKNAASGASSSNAGTPSARNASANTSGSGVVAPELANFITVEKSLNKASAETEATAASIRALLNDPTLTVRALPGNVAIVDGKVGTQAEYNRIDNLISGWMKSGSAERGSSAPSAGSSESVRVINNVMVDSCIAKQILVHVQVMDMDKTASKQLGADWGRVVLSQSNVPGQDAVRTIDDQPWLIGQTGTGVGTFGSFKMFDPIGARVSALVQQNKAKVLAEPNLLVLDCNEASMLVGGEIPIPIAQSTQTGTTVTIEYKEYGVRLKIAPCVTSENTMRLKVSPEVSSLDFANGVVMNGFSIPALSTRRAETTVNITSGQSLVIGGLVQKDTSKLVKKIPMLGDIPVLGQLFRSTTTSNDESELVIVVTPELVRPKKAEEKK